MEKIYLNNLLHFNQEDYGNIKIKFNQSNGYEDPMELYQSNPDIVNNQWLFWRSKQRYFYVGQIAICFLKLSYDTWLLTIIKKVTKELNIYDGINYEGEELEKYKSYFGRVVIKYHKTFQQQVDTMVKYVMTWKCNKYSRMFLMETIFLDMIKLGFRTYS